MKLQGAAVDRFIARPDPAIRAVLLYGPDEGLVRERAAAIGRQIVSDLGDPFRVATLTAEAIAADPTLLADEAASLSLMGGRRLVRVRDGSDKATRALDALLASPRSDSLTVIEAGDLGPRSSLRKLAEANAAAAALACYIEDEAGLMRTLHAQIGAAGKSIDPDAERALASSLVGDRMLARGEVDKLLVYMGDIPRIELADVEATIVDSASSSMDDAARAAAEGDFAGLDVCLERLAAESAGGIGILRASQAYFRKLHVTRARIDSGDTLDRALSQLHPPLFFKLKDAFGGQVRRWPLRRLADALDRLVAAEAASKRTGANDLLLAADALIAIARVARSEAVRRSR